jgi:thioesterase domain-containing protein
MTAPVAAGGSDPAATLDGPSPTLLPGGVRVERLRIGQADENLFIVPGLGGDPAELAALVSAFTGPQTVYSVVPWPEEGRQPPVATMERMAELIVAAIRRFQPSGPYRLGGYSFGGLAALETAQQLRAAGAAVEALFLIEAVYDERYWPRGIWLRAVVRRSGRQMLRIVRMHPVRAMAELRLRGVRLVQRVRRRRTDAPDPLRVDEATVQGSASSAISGYPPRFYDGPMTLIASSMDRHFGCDTVRLWAGYADRLDVQRIAGDHLTVMHDPASAAVVANVIDHRLARSRRNWTGLRPVPGFARPMIVTTMRWFSAARLAHALVEAGFSVSACRPAAHPLEVVEGLASDHRLTRRGRLDSLETAIRQAGPDIILPDDERALNLLRRLHARTRTTDPEIAALIARSLGNLEDWPVITSRTAVAKEARTLGVAAPETAVIATAEALTAWAAERNPPVVLKTDGSWGGRGVAVARRPADLPGAWRAVSNPPTLPRAIKRVLVNRELDSLMARLRRVRPVVNAQQFVEGREAIVTAACVDGKVSALVCLEVVRASECRGPAAVVRTIEHPAMAQAARRLVDRFGLSGFCGFDFIVTGAGEARLIELNPRVTPTCHLLVEGDHRRGRTLALFPPEPAPGTDPLAATSDVLDLPVRAHELIRRGRQLTARRRHPLARMTRRLTRSLSEPRC